MNMKTKELLPEVKSFLAEEMQLFIGGEWQAGQSNSTFDVIDPATQSRIAEAANADSLDVDLAVAAAQQAMSGEWSSYQVNERSKLLLRIAEKLERESAAIAQVLTLENGKPYANAVAEVDISARIFRYFSGWPDKASGDVLPINSKNGEQILNFTLHEPVGVCGLIVPWNFPLSMCAWKLAPAIACGCASILKPAEQTPLVAIYLTKLIEECGAPAGVVNLLTGKGAGVGAPLAAHDGVDKVAFTGSTNVGRLIAQAATGNMKKVSLELGGKSPYIIFPDANVKKAAKSAADAIFYNQGQVCTAASRLYVHESILPEFLDELKEHAKSLVMGAGLQTGTTLGPLVSHRQWQSVVEFIERAKHEGAELICGGGSSEENGWYVEPTIFLDHQESTCIAKEEIFGPVLTVMKWSDVEDVVERANSSPYGLAAGLWTNNLQKAHQVASQLKAGSVWVNCWNVVNPAAPFGGYKQSGWGREMGAEVLSAYTETKSVFVNYSE